MISGNCAWTRSGNDAGFLFSRYHPKRRLTPTKDRLPISRATSNRARNVEPSAALREPLIKSFTDRVLTRMGWLHAKLGKGQASAVFAFEWSRISSRTARKRREGSDARRRRRPTRRGQSPASLSLRVETLRDGAYAAAVAAASSPGAICIVALLAKGSTMLRRASHAKTGAAWASSSARASRKAAVATAQDLIRGSLAIDRA
jgi:hypothetical protein